MKLTAISPCRPRRYTSKWSSIHRKINLLGLMLAVSSVGVACVDCARVVVVTLFGHVDALLVFFAAVVLVGGSMGREHSKGRMG